MGMIIFSICMYCYADNQQDLFDDPSLWAFMMTTLFFCLVLDYIYTYIVDKFQILLAEEK